jgi:hypothetical protein
MLGRSIAAPAGSRSPVNLLRRIFDSHVHVEKGLAGYDLQVARKNVIFNTLQSYRSFGEAARSSSDAITLVLDIGPEFEFVRREAQSGRISALKIHSRIQKLVDSDWETVERRLEMLPADLPVVVDAFYHGRELQFQPSLPNIIRLLSNFEKRRFVIAHSGGYRMLEYFFHLREFGNCFYELALTLQYFEDSSLLQDLRKLIRFTDKERILFGSDFPFASPKRQCTTLLEICAALEMPREDVDKILYANAAGLFGEAAA